MKEFLTPDERLALEQQQKTERDRRIFVRIRCVLLKDAGWSTLQIAQAMALSQSAVDDYIREYREKQKLSPAHKGSVSKLSPADTAKLCAHLEAYCYSSAKEIAAYVQATYNVTYSVRGMTNWLHANGFSHKKPKKVPYKADT